MNFGELLWGMVIFFLGDYIWMPFAVFGDIFRRDDLSGSLKAGWIFLISSSRCWDSSCTWSRGRDDRPGPGHDGSRAGARAADDGYSASDGIEKAKKLLDSGRPRPKSSTPPRRRR